MLRLITGIKPYSRYLFIGWMVLILTVSSIPKLPAMKIETDRGTIRLDYLIHICEYGSLAFLAFLSYADDNFRLKLKKYALITAGLIIFSLIDEFHQKLIPGRTFNVKDIISNLTGIMAGLVFSRMVFSVLRKSHL